MNKPSPKSVYRSSVTGKYVLKPVTKPSNITLDQARKAAQSVGSAPGGKKA